MIFCVHDSYELIKYIRLTYPDTYDKIVEELLKEQYFENNLFQLLNEKKNEIKSSEIELFKLYSELSNEKN